MKTYICARTCIFFFIGLNMTLSENVNFGLASGVIPEKGSNISIECNFSQENRPRRIFMSKGGVFVAKCFTRFFSIFRCDREVNISDRYSITGNRPWSVIVKISNLQTSDAGDWSCGLLETWTTLYTLVVYSTPTGLVLNRSSKSKDLSVGGVDLICETSNCTYPAPETIQWFYKQGGTWHLYTNSTPSPSQGTCSGDEKVYSSTLSLVTNTVWPLQPANADITVRFQCRLPFPTLNSPLRSAESDDIKFAVQVTSVSLEVDDESTICSGTIIAINGRNMRISCIINTSRPEATIIWYIGSTVRQKNKSKEFIYNARHADNGKQIYCKAFNIQTEENAVSSSTLTLRVFEMHSTKDMQRASTTDKTNTNKQSSDNSTLIVGIVLGLVIVVLGLYAVIVTIKIKRKSYPAEEPVQSPSISVTKTTYGNVSYNDDAPRQHDTENEQYYSNAATGGYDNSMKVYTDLVRTAQDNQKTYDVIEIA